MNARSKISERLTIVMYHYVRPLQCSQYPNIKGLDLELFREQIRYLKVHYNMIGMEDLLDAIDAGDELPPRACLLTFDDGYSDHYRYVFPVMFEEDVKGAFYPPRSVVIGRQLLEVNKMHFILASVPDEGMLEAEVDALVDGARGRFDLPSLESLKAQYRRPEFFDTASVIYVKRLMQHGLPDPLRAEIASKLFARYVSVDEAAFAEELYLTLEQARVMASCGMHFGGHGDRHLWLSRLNEEGQRAEIDGASNLLDRIGLLKTRRTFCYPYGDYNKRTVELLSEAGYRAAFTSVAGLADRAIEGNFRLSRLDTNDFPKAADAALGEWTLAAY